MGAFFFVDQAAGRAASDVCGGTELPKNEYFFQLSVVFQFECENDSFGLPRLLAAG